MFSEESDSGSDADSSSVFVSISVLDAKSVLGMEFIWLSVIGESVCALDACAADVAVSARSGEICVSPRVLLVALP